MSCGQIHSDPDIYLIEVPSMFAPKGMTNCYLVKGGSRSLLVDVGGASPGAIESLEEGLAYAGVSQDEINYFFTHHHVDHIQNFASFALPGSTVYTSEESLRCASADHTMRYGKLLRRRSMQEGFSDQEVSMLVRCFVGSFAQFDAASHDVRVARDGDSIVVGDHCFSVVALPGHSRGQIGIYHAESRILACGDQVLYDMTPIIEVFDGGYQRNIDTLRYMRDMPISILLPGHGQIREDHYQRIDYLIDRNEMKVEQAYSAIKENPGLTCRDVIPMLEWSAIKSGMTIEDLTPIQKNFILASGISIIFHLLESGRVVEMLDSDGTFRYFVA